jgi:sec-independent protein translocase protein TatA
MFQQIRLPELLIIGAIILLLFGAKRLPDAARGLGRSMRIFKAETKGLVEDADTASAPIEPTKAEATEPAKDRTEG